MQASWKRVGMTIAALALLPGAAAGNVKITLQPGALAGSIQPVQVRPGETVAAIASRHGVHPIRVTRQSAKALKDGVEAGETLFVDQRRIVPVFDPGLSGIVLDLPGAHLFLVDKGAIRNDWPVAVSNGESEWRAPIGDFSVREKVKNPTWHIPVKIQAERARQGLAPKTKIEAGPSNPLGSRWIGFADGTYGIHGTLDPQSIKHYASHGCVRMNKAHVEALFDMVEVGTPIHVTYQPVQMATDARTVWLQVFPDFYHQRYNYHAAVKSLAAKANVASRLNWPAVEKAIKARDGMLLDVGQPLAPASPLVKVTPSPSPSPAASPAASSPAP